jgi:hypothetical protein
MTQILNRWRAHRRRRALHVARFGHVHVESAEGSYRPALIPGDPASAEIAATIRRDTIRRIASAPDMRRS